MWEEHQLVMDYRKELQKETPRGSVIISCVVIAELLGKTLENYLTDHKDVKAIMSETAPLGSLWARTVMCYGLRLIDEKEYKNFQIMRRIRNYFAHNLRASFDDQKVVDLCKQLDASGIRLRSTDALSKYNSVAAVHLHILANRPYMAVGRKIGEEGWQERVHKYIKKFMKEERASSRRPAARRRTRGESIQ